MKNKVCVYCGSAPGVQAEHVFPKSWYPDSTPRTHRRLTVPSCEACNVRFKGAEERFALAAIMTLDERSDGAGVYDRLSRSWKIDEGKSEVENRHRLRRYAGLIGRVVFGQPPRGQTDPVKGFLETPHAHLVAARPGSPVQNSDVDLIAEKFGKGLYFRETGAVIGQVTVTGRILNEDLLRQGGPEMPAFITALQRLPGNETLAPGLRYRFMVNEQDGDLAWLFQLWGQLDIVAFFALAR